MNLWLIHKKNLPEWKSSHRPKWATQKYLLGVTKDEYLSIPKDSVRDPVKVVQYKSKGELIKILEESTDKKLGFEIEFEPKIEWLITVIYSINPNHKIFQPLDTVIKTTLPAT